MTDKPASGGQNQDIEELIPWMANGRLDPTQRDAISRTLESDSRLQRNLAAAEEERLATLEAHAALPAPPLRLRESIMSRIEAEAGSGALRRATGLIERIGDWIRENFSPKTLALAGAVAAALIVIQAAAITDLAMRGGQTYQTASQETDVRGATLLVQFDPGARLADISNMLDQNGMTIVSGPRAGGFWQVRIGPADLSRDKIAAAEAALRAQSSLVRLVLPGTKS